MRREKKERLKKIKMQNAINLRLQGDQNDTGVKKAC